MLFLIQKRTPLPKLTLLEELIVLFLANGYRSYDLTDEYHDYLNIDVETVVIKDIIEQKLPVKCNVDNINQAMAVLYLKMPEIADCFYAEKRINKIQNLLNN